MIFLCLIILIHSFNPIIEVQAVEKNTCYARVLFDQVYLYKSPIDNNDYSNIYFELPKTYFVELISKHENFYEAKYLDFVGYVKKDSVQAVASTPINPFLININFRVYAELSQQLRSSPTIDNKSQNLIITIPNLTRNITYFGKLSGQCLIDGRTSVWYFCKYTSANKEYYGYVYSDFCDEMKQITPNNEELNYIDNPTFEISIQQPNTIPENSNAVGVVIAILSIPALIFIFLILKGGRFINKEKLKSKEIIDY